MIVSQQYTGRSSAILEDGILGLNLSTELGRPPVHLYATIEHGLAYARPMLALHSLVTSDHRTRRRDRSAYFAWVQQQYLDELPPEMQIRRDKLAKLLHQRQHLSGRVNDFEQRIATLSNSISPSFQQARRKYWKFLKTHDFDLWVVLDPVVSVHPDALIFEAFSQDESSYGRVTVPMGGLQVHDAVQYGTTNIDFSPELAREVGRIRSYRKADLHVGPERVVQATAVGAAVEKKVELPSTWVRGFLQVQSAATLPATTVRLSAATLADVLAHLRRHRDNRGPRSLRFILAPGKKPVIVIEPCDISVAESEYSYEGAEEQEIRIWGRRRLLVLESLLAHVSEIQVRLLGTGMPSFWTVISDGVRFDIGLSGWTQNDWAQAARFDLLASVSVSDPRGREIIGQLLQQQLHITSAQAAELSGLTRTEATTALQALCRAGEAMYDHIAGVYRWRRLFPSDLQAIAAQEDRLLSKAQSIVQDREVTWRGEPEDVIPPDGGDPVTRHTAEVETDSARESVLVDLDGDGRAVYAQCTCSTFRRDKLRKGPCAHILATAIAALQRHTKHAQAV